MQRISKMAFALLTVTSVLAAQNVPANNTSTEDGFFHFGKLFNPQTVETVNGKILHLSKIETRGGALGYHAVLKTPQGKEIGIHLGPYSYFQREGINLKEGEEVSVTGSRVGVGEHQFLIASKIKHGENTYTLRDETGSPLWSPKNVTY